MTFTLTITLAELEALRAHFLTQQEARNRSPALAYFAANIITLSNANATPKKMQPK